MSTIDYNTLPLLSTEETTSEEIIRSSFYYLERALTPSEDQPQYRIRFSDDRPPIFPSIESCLPPPSVYFNRDEGMQQMTELDYKLTQWIMTTIREDRSNIFSKMVKIIPYLPNEKIPLKTGLRVIDDTLDGGFQRNDSVEVYGTSSERQVNMMYHLIAGIRNNNIVEVAPDKKPCILIYGSDVSDEFIKILELDLRVSEPSARLGMSRSVLAFKGTSNRIESAQIIQDIQKCAQDKKEVIAVFCMAVSFLNPDECKYPTVELKTFCNEQNILLVSSNAINEALLYLQPEFRDTTVAAQRRNTTVMIMADKDINTMVMLRDNISHRVKWSHDNTDKDMYPRHLADSSWFENE